MGGFLRFALNPGSPKQLWPLISEFAIWLASERVARNVSYAAARRGSTSADRSRDQEREACQRHLLAHARALSRIMRRVLLLRALYCKGQMSWFRHSGQIRSAQISISKWPKSLNSGRPLLGGMERSAAIRCSAPCAGRSFGRDRLADYSTSASSESRPVSECVCNQRARAVSVGSTPDFCHHAASSPLPWTSRWCPRHIGTVNSSLTLRPSARL